MKIQIISKGSKNGFETAQVVIKAPGKSQTKHLQYIKGCWVDSSNKIYDLR